MITQTGYQKDTQGSWIAKDNLAVLTYTLDWSEWLQAGEQLTGVAYALQARANDPQPLVRTNQGFESSNGTTYVTLSGGQVGKVYTVTATITTNQSNTDRRSFRIRVENRSA
jgi:hypothetical protein